MKTHTLVLLAVVALAGCAATPPNAVKPLTTPDGKVGYLVSCDDRMGAYGDWTTCYMAATKACGGKYTALDRRESATATAYGPYTTRNMVAECR